MTSSSSELSVVPPAQRGFEHVQRVWEPAQQRWMAKILPGEFFVTRHDEVLSTVLGSCVSACICDSKLKVGGMNHFMLPVSSGEGQSDAWSDGPNGTATRYGSFAMEQLINELMKMGAKRSRLEVKLFGGGKILAAGTDIGTKNISFARDFLRQESLPVTAEDLGDIYPRRVMYFPNRGIALVKRLPALDAANVARLESQYLNTLATKPAVDDTELFT